MVKWCARVSSFGAAIKQKSDDNNLPEPGSVGPEYDDDTNEWQFHFAQMADGIRFVCASEPREMGEPSRNIHFMTS